MNEQELLKDLNPQQCDAVTHIDGPLLVIAGAGTGKTTVISRRIAWLIEQKLAKPEEILALTFTDKAAGEMEARVDVLVPYGYTDATIATFHSFGDRVLREHALDLGLPPEFRILGSDEQALFLGDRFDQIDDLVELRPVNGPRKYIGAILKVISRAKDELVSPDEYLATADKLLSTATDEETRREAARQKEIALIYAAYEQFKEQEGVLDFGDQIRLFYDLLQREPKVTARFHAQFKYILVDEFQDTNLAQYKLVKRLLNSHQNITVVGDDDQAIYKFRGAAVSNILGFLNDFPTAKTVVLTNNYRSSQTILDAAYQLIQHNNPDRLEDKLSINKHLVGLKEGTPPVFDWYEHDADELDGLVYHIKERLISTPPNQVAVLVRSNTFISAIGAALTQASIPFTASSDYGFVNLPEIRGIISFLKVLVHPDDSLAYTKLAFSPYYRLDPHWVLAVNDIARKANRDFDAVLTDTQSIVWEQVGTEGRQALEELRDGLARYRTLIGTKNAGEILYQFLRDRQILSEPTAQTAQMSLFAQKPEEERLAIIQNVAAVFDAVKRYSDAGRDPFALAFVDQLEGLLATIVPPTVDLGPDVPAVQIMTVHAAKGLEFEAVFLPTLTSDRFPARSRHDPLELPTELIGEILPTGDEHLQEERRLAYVALTRAKKHLYLSGAAKTGEGVRTKKPSPFVLEALGLTEVPPPIHRVSSAARMHTFAPHEPAPKTIRMPESDGVLFLSPAMIEAYTHDPYNFYWRYVLKAPTPPNRHINYGNAIHAAIEAYYRIRLASGAANLSQVLERFTTAWKAEGFDTRSDAERAFAHGQEVLAHFVTRADTEALPSGIEEEFTLILPGVRIRGRIDAIFEATGEIRDFKTSQVDTQKKAQEKLKENLPIRIYALAFRRKYGKIPSTLTLDFVETGERASLEPSEALLVETEALILATAANIRAGKFDPNPNNPFKDYD